MARRVMRKIKNENCFSRFFKFFLKVDILSRSFIAAKIFQRKTKFYKDLVRRLFSFIAHKLEVNFRVNMNILSREYKYARDIYCEI